MAVSRGRSGSGSGRSGPGKTKTPRRVKTKAHSSTTRGGKDKVPSPRSPISAPRKSKSSGRSGYTDSQPRNVGKTSDRSPGYDSALSSLTSMLANGAPQESSNTMYEGTIPRRPTLKDVTFGGLMGPTGGSPQYGRQVGSGLFEALTGMPGADEQGVAYGPDNLRPEAINLRGGLLEALTGIPGRDAEGNRYGPGNLRDNAWAPFGKAPEPAAQPPGTYIQPRTVQTVPVNPDGALATPSSGGLAMDPVMDGTNFPMVQEFSYLPINGVPSNTPGEPAGATNDNKNDYRMLPAYSGVDMPGAMPIGEPSTNTRVVTRPDGSRVVISTDNTGNAPEGVAIPTPSGLSIEQDLLNQANGAASVPTVAATAHSPEPAGPSIWDNTVDTLGNVAGATNLGRILNLINPEIGGGLSEWLKTFDNGGGPRGPRRPRNDSVNDRGNDISVVRDPGLMYSDPATGIAPATAAGVATTAGPGAYGAPATGVDGANPATTPAGTPVYDRWGNVVFPGIPPYNPGRDAEWLYFQGNNYADGGIVGAQKPAGYNPAAMSQMDPRIMIIADAEDALDGKSPNPDKALAAFVKAFGDVALKQLQAQVASGRTMRSGEGRLVDGPGGPKDDMVPARIEGKTEARLSDGEFIMSADAVTNAGEGDHKLGAERMSKLNEQLMGRDGKAPVKVEKVR